MNSSSSPSLSKSRASPTSLAASRHPVARPVQLAGREGPEHFLDLARYPGLEADACGGKHLGKGPGHGAAHEEVQAQLGDTRGTEGEAPWFQRHLLTDLAILGLGVDNDDPLGGVEDW